MLFFNKKNEIEKVKKVEDKGIIRKNVKDLKDLISPGGIDASYTNHLEIVSNTTRYARTMIVSTLPRTAVFPELLREMYIFGDSNTSVFIKPIAPRKISNRFK